MKLKQTILKNIKKTYGIGNETAKKLHKKVGINFRKSSQFIKKTLNIVLLKEQNTLLTTKKLQNFIQETIKFEQKIRTYRGIRNKLKYPCRGQRTHTNAKTKKKIKL